MPVVRFQSAMPVPPGELFAWHARPGALERLAPPDAALEVLSRRGTIRDGDELEMRVRIGPARVRWRARHEACVEGRQFADVQVRGPFRRWRHLHAFADREGGSWLCDTVDYELPLAPLSRRLAGPAVERRLDRLFAFRHARTAGDLARHQPHRERPRLTVGIAGHGPLPADLAAFLSTGGHRVLLVAPDGLARDPFDPLARAAPPPPLDALAVVAAGGDAPEPVRRLAAERGRRMLVLAPPRDPRDWKARDRAVGDALDALMGPGALRS